MIKTITNLTIKKWRDIYTNKIRKQNPQTGGRDDDQTWDCGEAAVAGKSRFQVRSH